MVTRLGPDESLEARWCAMCVTVRLRFNVEHVVSAVGTCGGADRPERGRVYAWEGTMVEMSD